VSRKLHTVIALREGEKARHRAELTAAHRQFSRPEQYEGQTRTYRPKADDGDALPEESKNVQANGDAALNALVRAVASDWNLMATVNVGDQRATADVTVPTEDGARVLLREVPTTFLLYLARELDDVRKYLAELPTLDPAVRWRYDENVGAYVADPVTTHRTQKVLQNHIKYEATDRHPAQVETFTTDVVVGYWTLVRRSGALPAERKAELLQRVDVLRQAVREARQRAADVDVDEVNVARPVFDYLLGG
jgi:hypothetical protein